MPRLTPFDCFSRWRHGRGALQVMLVLLALLAPATAALAADPSELGARAREHFEVLPLREGVLLKPIHPTTYAVIEITQDGVAIDGEELSGRALRRRLGDDAEVVQDLAELDADELREVGSGKDASRHGGTLSTPPAPPAAPGATAPPAEPAVPAVPEPPAPPRPPRGPRRHSDAKVSVASSAHVERGETSEDVFVLGGEVTVDGTVSGDAVAVGGEVHVDGEVSGDVVSVGGDVFLGPNADVDGDVTSVGGHVRREPGARVGGRTSEVAMGPLLRTGALGRLGRHSRVDFEPFEHVSRIISSGFRLVLFGLFGCLVILLAREPLERVADKVGEEVWRCGLTGLAAQVLVVPLFFITFVLLMVSVIGIPLVVLLPFAALALVIGSFLGYTAVAVRIGRYLERRFGWNLGSPYLAMMVGVLCIQGWTLLGRALDWDVTPLGLFSGLLLFGGFVLQYIVWTVGLGSVLITRFGTYAVWRGWRWHRPEHMPPRPGEDRTPIAPQRFDDVPPIPPPPAPPADDAGDGEQGESETKPGS